MEIQEALTAERVSVHLAACDRFSALRALAEAFARADARLSTDALHAAFDARDRLGNTQLGTCCAAVPLRVPELGAPQLAVIVLREPITDHGTGGEVRILLGLLSDLDEPAAHLARIRALVRILREPLVREALLEATDAAGVLHALGVSASYPLAS